MENKTTLIGVGGMLLGAILVIIGLLKVPIVAACLVIVGGAVGFVGYKIYENRRKEIPNDLELG